MTSEAHPTAVLGIHYFALSFRDREWLIMRGRFEMGRFNGTPEEVKDELEAWDKTVISTPNGVTYTHERSTT